MTDKPGFKVTLKLLEDYLFEVDFDEYGYIITDEAPPLGKGEGPNPMRLIGAAVGNCLCASLLFALSKKKQQLLSISAEVEGHLERVDGRWRIAQMQVAMRVDAVGVDQALLDEALAQFEDFCVVTQSVRAGIPVAVTVTDQAGRELHHPN